MTPEERRVRASRIREAMSDGVIADAFDDIEQQFVDEWKRSATVDERENCFRAIRVLQAVRQRLGALSSDRLDQHEVTAIRRIK